MMNEDRSYEEDGKSKKNDVLLYMTLRRKRAWTDRVLEKNSILKTVTERSTEKESLCR